MTLMSYDQIAARLEVSRRYARDIVTKRTGFPAPALRISQKVVYWAVPDFDKWLGKEREKLAR